MQDYKKKLGSLADRIKNETPQLPIQEVQPVKQMSPEAKPGEARFNNWIPKELKRKVKSYGVDNDMSQKDITIEALKDFLLKKGIDLS